MSNKKDKEKNQNQNPYAFRYIEDQEMFFKVVERLKLTENNIIGLDSETFYDGNAKIVKLSVLQLATMINGRIEAFVIDCLAVNILKLKEILEDYKYLKIIHNAGYDIGRVKENTGMDILNVWCTQRAERKTKDQLNLEAVAKKYSGVIMDKELQRSRWELRPLTKEQKVYSAKDAIVLIDIYIKQKEKGLDGSFISKHVSQSIFDLDYGDSISEQEEITEVIQKYTNTSTNTSNTSISAEAEKENIVEFKLKDQEDKTKVNQNLISNFDLYTWLYNFISSGKSLNYRPSHVKIDGAMRSVKTMADNLQHFIENNKNNNKLKTYIPLNFNFDEYANLDVKERMMMIYPPSEPYYSGCVPAYTNDYMIYRLYKVINGIDTTFKLCEICKTKLILLESLKRGFCQKCYELKELKSDNLELNSNPVEL